MFHKSALDPEDHASWTANNRVFDPRSTLLRSVFNISFTSSGVGAGGETEAEMVAKAEGDAAVAAAGEFQRAWDAVVLERTTVAEAELGDTHFNAWWESAKNAASQGLRFEPLYPHACAAALRCVGLVLATKDCICRW